MSLLKVLIVILVSYTVESCFTSAQCTNTLSHINVTEADTKNKTFVAYCTSAQISLSAENLSTITLKNDITDITRMIMKKINDDSSYECKNFTKLMSLKHQLQHYLFQQNPSTQQIELFSSILVSLQTLTDFWLDKIRSKTNSHCVRLSARGYRMMYHVFHDNTSLLDSLKQLPYAIIEEQYSNGNNPPACACKKLFEFLFDCPQ